MENTKMQRLYFRKSKNKTGQDCFIAKVKEFAQEVGKKKEFLGDVIVIANADKCKIHKTGRWDVEVKKMFGAKGYLVTDAEWTIDLLDLYVDWDNLCVFILVNGEQTKLKRVNKETGNSKFLPLLFNSEDYYPIEKIVENIREKSIFLQLSPAFNLDHFLEEFSRASQAVYDSYRKQNVGFATPNTPMAEMLKGLKK